MQIAMHEQSNTETQEALAKCVFAQYMTHLYKEKSGTLDGIQVDGEEKVDATISWPENTTTKIVRMSHIA